MHTFKTITAASGLLLLAATSHAQLVDKKGLSLAAAKKIAAAAEAEAKARHAL